MIKLLRNTAAVAAFVLSATPALAATPTQQASATARIVKPLTITWVQDLDLGTVIQGAGTWGPVNVGITRAGVFSCGASNVTCSGATRVARYRVTGTNNQTVNVSAGNVTLTHGVDNTQQLTLTVDRPASFNLANSGVAGYDLDLGGSIPVSSTTMDGTYTGFFNVTVDY